MMLKQGQIINDGDSDLIVCDVKEYEGKTYAYMMNDNNSEVGFYEVVDLGEEYDFNLVEDEKLNKELILIFAKDYANKNPEIVEEVNQIINNIEESEEN